MDELRTALTSRASMHPRLSERSRSETPSAAAQKLVERGSCCEFGVVDPFEGFGGGVAVFDECDHAGNEIVA